MMTGTTALGSGDAARNTICASRPMERWDETNAAIGVRAACT